jgi:Flp pilus assembly protein TadD
MHFMLSYHCRRLITQAIYLVLLSMAWIFAGCATIGTDREPAPVGGTSVSRLEDGREGFVIMESSGIDSESRRYFERAVVLMENRNYEKAIELLETVVERSPGVTAPYINIAIACKRVGRFEEAEQYLKTALSLVPEHPVASNEYGLLLRRTGRFAEARAVYEKMLTIFPGYHPVRRNLGILCDLYLNDLTCALDHYEIYSAAMPDDEQVKLWVADLRLRTGR